MWIYMQLCGTPGDWKNRAVGSLNCLNISNQTILASIWRNTPRLFYTKYSKAFLDKKLDIWKRCSSIAFFPDLKAPPFPNKYRLGLHKKLGATKLPLEWMKPLQNFFYLRLTIPWNEQRKTSFGHKLVRLTSGTAVGFGRFQIQLAHIVALYHR